MVSGNARVDAPAAQGRPREGGRPPGHIRTAVDDLPGHAGVSPGRRRTIAEPHLRRDRDPPGGVIDDRTDLGKYRHAVGMQAAEQAVAAFRFDR